MEAPQAQMDAKKQTENAQDLARLEDWIPAGLVLAVPSVHQEDCDFPLAVHRRKKSLDDSATYVARLFRYSPSASWRMIRPSPSRCDPSLLQIGQERGRKQVQ